MLISETWPERSKSCWPAGSNSMRRRLRNPRGADRRLAQTRSTARKAIQQREPLKYGTFRNRPRLADLQRKRDGLARRIMAHLPLVVGLELRGKEFRCGRGRWAEDLERLYCSSLSLQPCISLRVRRRQIRLQRLQSLYRVTQVLADPWGQCSQCQQLRRCLLVGQRSRRQ